MRIVAATNANLIEKVNSGKFREDLYYRLNTVPITVPSLRERREDIYLLFRKFAADFAEKYRGSSVQLDEAAKEMLENYNWPGNIRELKKYCRADLCSFNYTNPRARRNYFNSFLPLENAICLF